MTLVPQITRELAQLRRKQGLTQEDLAELLEVPVQHVSRIEAGQNITLATLERVAIALGLTVEVTFKDGGGKPKKPPLTQRQKLKKKR